MDGVLQRVVSILISVVIFFILPIYIAYEKKDDISYALALKITTDFVDNVNSKGYITSEMYDDFIAELAVTQNSYDVYMEHTAKKYNPVIYSYNDDMTTIRSKFDYNLYKDDFEDGEIVIDNGANAGTYNNLILAYDLSEKKYTEEQIIDVISSTDKTLHIDKNLDVYKKCAKDIMQGIKDIDLALKNTDIHHNIAAQNALIHYLLDTRKHKNLSVMMPYSGRLKYVSDWYVQLWAESLGKNKDNDGNPVNIGPTPLKALGATDQHSQIQLYNEGPNDKIINFIRVKEFETKLEIPKIFEFTGIGYLGGKTINELINAEADATKVALIDYQRPNVTITLPEINGYYMGQLLYMLEVQTAIAGELYNINTFNQPGVEQAKNYTYALMGRAGYEESAAVLKEKMTVG